MTVPKLYNLVTTEFFTTNLIENHNLIIEFFIINLIKGCTSLKRGITCNEVLTFFSFLFYLCVI